MMERQTESSPRGAGCPESSPSNGPSPCCPRCPDGPIGVTEVAERADLPKSTAARMLASLSHEGRGRAGPGRHALPPRAADRDARRRRGPGAQPRRDGAGRSSRSSPRRPARPRACRSPRASSSTTSTRSARATRSRSATGPGRASRCTRCRPASCSSPSCRRRRSRRTSRATSRRSRRGRSRTPDALRERLVQVRADGYAWVHEEFAEGLNSVAAASPTRPASSPRVHVHGPAYRFPPAARPRSATRSWKRRRAPPSASVERLSAPPSQRSARGGALGGGNRRSRRGPRRRPSPSRDGTARHRSRGPAADEAVGRRVERDRVAGRGSPRPSGRRRVGRSILARRGYAPFATLTTWVTTGYVADGDAPRPDAMDRLRDAAGWTTSSGSQRLPAARLATVVEVARKRRSSSRRRVDEPRLASTRLIWAMGDGPQAACQLESQLALSASRDAHRRVVAATIARSEHASRRRRSGRPRSTAVFSSRNTVAPTISSICASRPIGVSDVYFSIAAGLPAQYGLSPTTPGWIEFDPDRLELLDQRPGQPDDAAVHRRDRRRARVGPLLRHPAEQHDRRRGRQPVAQRVARPRCSRRA